MKRFLRFGLPALAFVIFLNAFAASEASAQGILREILDRMDKHNQALTSLRANVTMAKWNAQLDDTEVTTGNAIYGKRKGKDALVRIDWVKPDETLAVVDGQYVMYRPRLNIAYTGSVKKTTGNAKANSGLAFMNMSKEQLKANYAVAYLDTGTLSDGTKTAHLQMTPKTKTSYKTAELWVDAHGMPVQTKIIENNNDTTTVLLTNIQKNPSNPSLKGSDFNVVLPQGTKIVKS